MFTGAINLMPGQELREFDVYRNGTRRTDSGRVISNGAERLGAIRAVLAAAKPEEIERWRQLEHPVTHTFWHGWQNGESRWTQTSWMP